MKMPESLALLSKPSRTVSVAGGVVGATAAVGAGACAAAGALGVGGAAGAAGAQATSGVRNRPKTPLHKLASPVTISPSRLYRSRLGYQRPSLTAARPVWEQGSPSSPLDATL